MGNRDHHFLHKFFYPERVAIVGASRNPLRPNHNLLANLVNLGFKGKVYPVNPETTDILGVKTYPDLKSIEGPIDLAVVAVPHYLTLGLLQDCVAKGIKRVTIVAGGFSETGEEGKRVQREIAALLKQKGVRAIGPNALSPINASTNFAISFFPIERLKVGGLSLIFQSGLYEPRLDWLFSDFNLHLCKLIDLGNKMDINEVDALTYLSQDPQTKVIGIHLESIEGNGREFLRLVREVSQQKHVVVLKSGRTEAGAKAAASHTGVIVQGSDRVFDAALKQAGAIRAQTIEDFFDLARALERFGTLLLPGNRVAIATLPGGEAVIVTDLCQVEGLTLARLQDQTIAKVRPVSAPWEISVNPFDLGVALQFIDPRKVYFTLLDALVNDPNVDGIAIQVPSRAFNIPREFFQSFPQSLKAQKPIALWVAGIPSGREEVLEWLEEQNIPVFPNPEKVIRALAALHRSSFFKLLRKPLSHSPLSSSPAKGG
ncbi:MAG: CoA-binding protein [Thermodesulfobacteriota bacterium]|jgi:acetyltransferase